METKKFREVFEKTGLPASVTKPFLDTSVTDIKLDKAANAIELSLFLPEILDEGCFDALGSAISEAYKLERCKVRGRYELSSADPGRKVELYWKNLISAVKKISPLGYAYLENANYTVAGGTVKISTPAGAAFLLAAKGLDRAMGDLLLERLGLNLTVVFEDALFDKRKREKYEMEQKRERASLAATENSPQAEDEPSAVRPKRAAKYAQKKRGGAGAARVLEEIKGTLSKLGEELVVDDRIICEGRIIASDRRETKSGKIIATFDITDGTDSITVKLFTTPEEYAEKFAAPLKAGKSVRVNGRVQLDSYSNEINIMAREVAPSEYGASGRADNAAAKRVELHLHTTMSQMDAVNTASDYINQAVKWGHGAVAITDHGVAQAFPDAMSAAEGKPIKVIYGVEGYFLDDLNAVVKGKCGEAFDACEFVAFDIETTGLKPATAQIIEIGAVRIRNLEVAERFHAFVYPRQLLSAETTKLTGITDEMLENAETIDAVLPRFREFAGDCPLVAHNAVFDTAFIRLKGREIGISFENASICTVELSRSLFPEMGNHKLDSMCKRLEVELLSHHRAADDAAACAGVFIKCVQKLRETREISNISDLNDVSESYRRSQRVHPYHGIILVKNQKGLRNLYELISKSHIDYFAKRPRIPKSLIAERREGLILGTACEAGEFFTAVRDCQSDAYIRELADFYDYLEIQPHENNEFMLRDQSAKSRRELIDLNMRIVGWGEKLGKIVVATCDAHFLNPEDALLRRIIQAGDGYKDADEGAPLYFRTTEEMLAEFEYLGSEKAHEIVVTNTNLIAGMIEKLKPIPDGTYPPVIPGAEEKIKEITMARAKEIYGERLPEIVLGRLNRELESIIKNGFSVMYIIAQKLVWDSVEHGYLVGSRGSVGSSLVATMAGITEVNPLPPHYVCRSCQFSDFSSDEVREFAGASGCDMPDRKCPNCGAPLAKDGHDIPFETFLGFDGDKEPDIDLNFSGEYQAQAHAYTEKLFGEGFVFKAGTIGTLADKTAYGYVAKYFEERGAKRRNAEINRLVQGLVGVKRTTGQHPGGLMIVPDYESIYNFCPIQRPANDMSSDVTTTHFDYHAISGRLLKLDLLGHDVPTIIKMLHDFTGVDPRVTDLGDKEVLSLFTSPRALGVSEEAIGCKTGSLGLPEFGTGFVRGMLMETRPSSFSELVRISGLSHGTDVWNGNAQELVKNGVATLREIIPTRDDIMVYLINKGVEKKAAFNIMERVRKGKGLTQGEEEILRAADVPEWYIGSCKKIKYMFPKGHAVAYVMMTVRIGWFKIHHPLAFYAASFSVKLDSFDYVKMCTGEAELRKEMKRISAMEKDATAKEQASVPIFELVREMYARGFSFAPLDLYKSDAVKFQLVGGRIRPPLCSIQGLGINAAENIVAARADGEFISVQDFRNRTSVSKNVIEILNDNGILNGIPETNQITLFGV